MIMRQGKAKGELVEVEGGGRIIRSLPRKDRHSKVCTSKGLRDRRVRLSADTAIRFYDVQDRLGYDRPSKAIDWLMKEAKRAIDALNNDHDVLTTILDASEAFHRTSGERYQQVSTHTQISSFSNHPLELINSRNKRDEIPIEDLSPMDFTKDPSYDPGEDFAFVDREPLQSSSTTIIDAFNNEFVDNEAFLGFHFQQADQVEESWNLVSKHQRTSGTSVFHYKD